MFFLLCYGLCVHSSFNLKMCASLPLSFLLLSFSPSSLLLLSFSPSLLLLSLVPSPLLLPLLLLPVPPRVNRYKVQQGHAAKLAMGPELRAALTIQGQYRSRKTRLEVRRARRREVARTTNGTFQHLR